MSALTWLHRVNEIPRAGLSASHTADADTRAAVAADLSIPALHALEVSYKIVPQDEGRYRVSGEVTAELELACVVTLEPVMQRLDEPIDVAFWPDALPQLSDVDFDPLTDPDIEPIENGRLDLGRIVMETIASAIDLYPRAQDAELEASEARGGGDESPFAALAQLKSDTTSSK